MSTSDVTNTLDSPQNHRMKVGGAKTADGHFALEGFGVSAKTVARLLDTVKDATSRVWNPETR